MFDITEGAAASTEIYFHTALDFQVPCCIKCSIGTPWLKPQLVPARLESWKSLNMFLTYFLHLNRYCVTTEYHFQGTTFVCFSFVTSTLKLKTHSQLTQSPFTGTDCLFI